MIDGARRSRYGIDAGEIGEFVHLLIWLFGHYEGEHLLDRLAVAGRHRDVVDPQGVGDPAVREERHRLAGAGAIDPSHAVVVPHPDARDVGERLLALDPAVSRDDHPRIFIDDVVLFPELDLFGGPLDLRAAGVAIGLGDRPDLLADDIPARPLVRQQPLDLVRALSLLSPTPTDWILHDHCGDRVRYNSTASRPSLASRCPDVRGSFAIA